MGRYSAVPVSNPKRNVGPGQTEPSNIPTAGLHEFHDQPRTGRLGEGSKTGKRPQPPTAVQPRDNRPGHARSPGKFRPGRFRGHAGAHRHLDQRVPIVNSRMFFPEPGIPHEAVLQILQFRHGVTCPIRCLAVASARRGVSCDFLTKT